MTLTLGFGTSGLTRMVSEDLNQQLVRTLLELVNDGVVKRVLVLLKPSRDVVADLFDEYKVKSESKNFRKTRNMIWVKNYRGTPVN